MRSSPTLTRCWAGVGLVLLVLSVACTPAAPAADAPGAQATIESLNAELARFQASPTPAPPAAPTAIPTTVAVPTAAPSPTPLGLEDAIAAVKRSTVYVWTDLGSGSGISLGRGQVLTNNHVVQGAGTVNVRFADGRQEPVHVIRADARRDLALLQSSFVDVPGAALRDARGLRDGESLIAVGYPRTEAIGARDPTVTRGIVSGRWQSPQGVWHVQTDTPANPGNSGGPLTDSQGQVVGVVTFGVRQAVGLNFALASDEVHAFLNGTDVPASAPAAHVPAALPELSSTSVTPQIAAPGAVLTFNYELTYDGEPTTVVLGASVRTGGGAWISDPPEDVRVTLRPGRMSFTRQFHLPSTAEAGQYDVAWGLLGTDLQTSLGLVTHPGALSVASSGPIQRPNAALGDALARVAQENYKVFDTSAEDPA